MVGLRPESTYASVSSPNSFSAVSLWVTPLYSWDRVPFVSDSDVRMTLLTFVTMLRDTSARALSAATW